LASNTAFFAGGVITADLKDVFVSPPCINKVSDLADATGGFFKNMNVGLTEWPFTITNVNVKIIQIPSKNMSDNISIYDVSELQTTRNCCVQLHVLEKELVL
jgi:hypothetical protein